MNQQAVQIINLVAKMYVALLTLIFTVYCEENKRWLNRRWFVRPINARRNEYGFFNTLFQELKFDSQIFFQMFRMDMETFQLLLKHVEKDLRKKITRPDVINTEQRLAITLRYLATGDEINSLALDYRIGKSTTYNIIKETCKVIFNNLSPTYLRTPKKPVWRNICKGFYSNWNLPNCCGAIDGKHIQIKAPVDSGSLFYNYKKTNSIVLLAACNHRYEFTICDVGAYGGESDGGIFERSGLAKAIEEDFGLEKEVTLPNSRQKTPMYFVGDEAFKISQHVMRPYPGRHLSRKQRIFNYRLSRARRCIENAFGILVSRWRVFSKPIGFQPHDVDIIVLSAVCLHNFLMARTQKSVRNMYCSSQYVDGVLDSGLIEEGQWRNNEVNTIFQNCIENHRRGSQAAYDMRDMLANYFISPEGEIPWQEEYINRGRFQENIQQ